MESFESREMPQISMQEASEVDIKTLLSLAAKIPSQDIYSPLLKKREWKKELKNGTVNLIKNGDELVGCFAYEFKGPAHIYISELFVIPEYQRKGIARDMLTKFITEHPEATRIDLTTHPDNPAVELYKSLGFNVEERIENYYNDGQPRLILAFSR